VESNLIRLPEVRRMVGNPCEATIYKWIRRRDFPKPGRLGGRVSVWNRRDVQRWIDRSLQRVA
jgi:predicted DNA-binding transcriptional regulator AlpA